MSDSELKNDDKKNDSKLPVSDRKLPPPGGSSPMQTAFVWLAVIIIVTVSLHFLNESPSRKTVELTYSQFQALIAEPGHVKKAEVIQKAGLRATLNGDATSVELLTSVAGRNTKVVGTAFTVNIPFLDSEMLKAWDSKGFIYEFKEEKMGFSDYLPSILPFILMVVIFWFLMGRAAGGGQKGMFSFGKSRAKLQDGSKSKTTFNDVAGVEEAKAELAEVVDFLKAPEKYRKLGGKIPKGVLLLGPPGTGKTLLARAVAGEAKVPFFSMSGSDFVEMFVGVGASRVRDLFETAKKNAPCIIFIDEIDAVGRQRGAGVGGGHDEREQTLNQMLVEMDGFEENSGIILIAATNRPDVLDPALLRPGRFDRQVVVDAPDVRGREGILLVHTKNVPISEEVDLKLIAKGTPGFVGADLANLVNEAALMAARFNQSQVTMLDFEEARDKIVMGAERNSKVLTEKDKRIVAYHEAGHAICHLFCENSNPLHKVTIIPRGRALGVTWSLPQEDILHHTRSYILDQVCIYMGGRAAERMLFGEVTNGAYGDIKGATDLVRKMICDFGMTDEMGPISYGKKEEQIFLGREIANHRDYSEKTAESIDDIMKSVIVDQEKRALAMLAEHRKELDLLAEALIEHELLDREEIDLVLRGETLGIAKKSRSTELYRRIRNVESVADEANNETIASKESSQEGGTESSPVEPVASDSKSDDLKGA